MIEAVLHGRTVRFRTWLALCCVAAGCNDPVAQSDDVGANKEVRILTIDAPAANDDSDDGTSWSPDAAEQGSQECAINQSPVRCEIALWDIAAAEAGASGKPSIVGLNPKSYCKKRCDLLEKDGVISGDWLLQDKGVCAHSTRVHNFLCAGCAQLSESPAPLFCDGNPCTKDSCTGDACKHDPYSWIGEQCTQGDCVGKYACDPNGCPPDLACDTAKLMKCIGCQ